MNGMDGGTSLTLIGVTTVMISNGLGLWWSLVRRLKRRYAVVVLVRQAEVVDPRGDGFLTQNLEW